MPIRVRRNMSTKKLTVALDKVSGRVINASISSSLVPWEEWPFDKSWGPTRTDWQSTTFVILRGTYPIANANVDRYFEKHKKLESFGSFSPIPMACWAARDLISMAKSRPYKSSSGSLDAAQNGLLHSMPQSAHSNPTHVKQTRRKMFSLQGFRASGLNH